MGSETVTFGEVAKLIKETVQPEDVAGMPYIGLGHIEEGNLQLNGFGQADDVTSTKFTYSKGDILFGKLRPYFRKVIRAPFDGICSTDIWVVRAEPGTDQGYLYYWMASKAFVDFSTQGSEGTRMPRAKWEHVSRYSQKRLSLPEQRAIAHILGTLDDKIELNRQMNATLEAIARAIFKSWFVDLDPVRANRGELDLSLPPDLLALFPDAFVESELGAIPAGWEVGAYTDQIEIISGGTPRTSNPEYWDGDIPWFSVKDAPDSGDVFVIDTERKVTPEGVENSSTKILPINTSIISARGTVGKLALVGVPMAMNQSCYGIRAKAGYSNYYTFFSLQAMVDRLQQNTHGSVFDTITRRTFRNMQAVKPAVEIAQAFDRMVEPMLKMIRANRFQSRTLAQLRDTLLPKLISGELRVPEAMEQMHLKEEQ